jgi:hypothetical protein
MHCALFTAFVIVKTNRSVVHSALEANVPNKKKAGASHVYKPQILGPSAALGWVGLPPKKQQEAWP